MQNIFPLDTGTTAGTIGGTFTCILCSLQIEDMIQTTFLATIGAIVSFLVSLTLKLLIRRIKK